MPNSSHLSQQIAQKTGLAVLLGVIVWVGLLISGAARVRGTLGADGYDITFGPLVLNQIARTPLNDSYTISLSFENGLLGYFLLWTVLGVMVGFLLARRGSRTQ